MDYQEKINEYQKAFALLDEICLLCLKETEEETRKALKEEIRKRFERAPDDVERSIVLTVQQYLKNMSYDVIKQIALSAQEKTKKKHRR